MTQFWYPRAQRPAAVNVGVLRRVAASRAGIPRLRPVAAPCSRRVPRRPAGHIRSGGRMLRTPVPLPAGQVRPGGSSCAPRPPEPCGGFLHVDTVLLNRLHVLVFTARHPPDSRSPGGVDQWPPESALAREQRLNHLPFLPRQVLGILPAGQAPAVMGACAGPSFLGITVPDRGPALRISADRLAAPRRHGPSRSAPNTH